MRKCIRGVVVISNTACITNKREMGDDAQRTEKNCKNQRFKLFYNFFFLSWPRLFTKKKDSSCIRHAAAAASIHPSLSL